MDELPTFLVDRGILDQNGTAALKNTPFLGVFVFGDIWPLHNGICLKDIIRPFHINPMYGPILTLTLTIQKIIL
jgi:hypothetical protein